RETDRTRRNAVGIELLVRSLDLGANRPEIVAELAGSFPTGFKTEHGGFVISVDLDLGTAFDHLEWDQGALEYGTAIETQVGRSVPCCGRSRDRNSGNAKA